MLSVVATSAIAEEQISEGGRSPDGAYEVRIERQATKGQEPVEYGIYVQSVNPQKRIFTLPEIGGYLGYGAAIERDHSYWHGSSRFVAITDQRTRHSRELYVVAIADGKPTVIPQPDFYQNALGRVNAVEIDFSSVVTPQKWDGDDLILQLHLTANHRRGYTFEVVLNLTHEKYVAPHMSLKSVKLLKEDAVG